MIKNLSTSIQSKTAILIALNLICLSGCKGSAGGSHLPSLKYSQNNHPGNVASNAESQGAAKRNMQEEMAVVGDIRKAWKLAAVKNDKKGALEILEKLDKEHPGISTVQMMMGQVEEHFGDHEAAIKHYRKAYNVNQFSSMQTYKLATSLRKSGDAKGSIVYYKKLEKRLESAVNEYKEDSYKALLVSVRLGLAEALIESGSKPDEVLAVLKKLNSTDKKTKKQANQLLSKLSSKFPDSEDTKALLKEFKI